VSSESGVDQPIQEAQVSDESEGEFVSQARTPMCRKNSQGTYGSSVEVNNRQTGVRQVVRGGLEFAFGRPRHAAYALKGHRTLPEFSQHGAGLVHLNRGVSNVVPKPAGGVPSVNVDVRVGYRNTARVQIAHKADLLATE
jgi:hypothetical protein